MREKPSSCARRLICHPERSEGSAFTTEHLNYPSCHPRRLSPTFLIGDPVNLRGSRAFAFSSALRREQHWILAFARIVKVQSFVDNVHLFLPLLCKEGQGEVESMCRATSHAIAFVGAASHAARKKRHEMAPLQKRGKRVSPDSVNE